MSPAAILSLESVAPFGLFLRMLEQQGTNRLDPRNFDERKHLVVQLEKQKQYRRSVEELAEIFSFLDGLAEEVKLGPRDRYALNFAAEELFTNFVKYNNGTKAILLRVRVCDDGLTLELEDKDVADFDPETAKDPRVDAGLEDRVPGGLGLHLVRSLFDSLDYQYSDGVLKVVARKLLEAAA